MKTVQQLQTLRDDMRTLLGTVQGIRSRFNEQATRVRSDASRHPSYVSEKIDEARSRAFAEFGKPIADLRALNAAVQSERPYWQATWFVLAQQHCAADPAHENATRARHHAELMAMPAGLAWMTFQHAKREGNFGLVYQCALVDQARRDEAGWTPFDLRNITIPAQVDALEVIRQCSAMSPEADNAVAEVSGRRVDNPLESARARLPKTIEPSLEFDDGTTLALVMAPDPVNGSPGLPLDRLAASRRPAEASEPATAGEEADSGAAAPAERMAAHRRSTASVAA